MPTTGAGPKNKLYWKYPGRDTGGKQDWRPVALYNISPFIITEETLLICDKALFILKQNFCF